MPRFCLECNQPISGRIDKRFCDDACRNHYNNRQNRDRTQLMRNTHHVLRKNYRILSGLNPKDKTKISRKRLLEEGFSFDHITQFYRTRKGTVYYFVYDQGYLPLENDWYMLVKRD